MGAEAENNQQDLVHCVEFTVDAVDVIPLEEALAALGFAASSWTERETGKALVRVYAESADQADTWHQAITEGLAAWQEPFSVGIPEAVRGVIRREDWSESWKQYFHAFRVADRLLVKPSWEDVESRPGDIVIELDPGMCFGTGHHGTTRACLEFIDQLARDLGPVAFLDAGCGSGILSLAASRLGLTPCAAFDHDPQAVTTARENLARQDVIDVDLMTSDLADYVPTVPPRIVVANILAPVLLQHHARILSWFSDQPLEGHLVLSGILHDQYDAIVDTFTKAGAVEVTRRSIDEWTSGRFVVPA